MQGTAMAAFSDRKFLGKLEKWQEFAQEINIIRFYGGTVMTVPYLEF